MTRGYARIQVDTPTPGVYYVMIRTASPSATDDDDHREGSEEDLTVVTSILPRDHPEVKVSILKKLAFPAFLSSLNYIYKNSSDLRINSGVQQHN